MAYEKKKAQAGILEIFAIAILIMIAVAVPFAIVFGPGLMAKLSSYLEPKAGPAGPPPEQTDFDRYFRLKNLSCGLLSEDFLVVTSDAAFADVRGLADSPGQYETAGNLLSKFEYNQTTRTYLRGDWMKIVLQSEGLNHTTIWKEGRIYQCAGNCTMRLLGDAGWQAHLDAISRIRTGCAHFGRTKLPDTVNMTRLLSIERVGSATLHGSRCERFLIGGDKEYAASLLDSPALDDDQRAVLWTLTHLAYPVEECLDEGRGLLLSRTLTLDLTKTYSLDYYPGGFMHLVQSTETTYYTGNVPASFFTAN